jgi:hypothetical protein
VADREKNEILVHAADGELQFTFGGRGAGPGYFFRPKGVAFDASRDRRRLHELSDAALHRRGSLPAPVSDPHYASLQTLQVIFRLPRRDHLQSQWCQRFVISLHFSLDLSPSSVESQFAPSILFLVLYVAF